MLEKYVLIEKVKFSLRKTLQFLCFGCMSVSDWGLMKFQVNKISV